MLCHDEVIKNWKIFRVTGLLWDESIGHRWFPLTKDIDAELWCFIWCSPQQTVEQTIETPMIWGAMALIVTSLWWRCNILLRCNGSYWEYAMHWKLPIAHWQRKGIIYKHCHVKSIINSKYLRFWETLSGIVKCPNKIRNINLFTT